jgi:hypothetical protein
MMPKEVPLRRHLCKSSKLRDDSGFAIKATTTGWRRQEHRFSCLKQSQVTGHLAPHVHGQRQSVHLHQQVHWQPATRIGALLPGILS